MKPIATLLFAALVLSSACSRRAAESTGLATPADQTAQAQPAQPSPPPEISIPDGTVFRVRLEQTIDTRRNRSGDPFFATLDVPVVEDGTMVIPKNTRFTGHVVESKSSGRLKGRAQLTLGLDSFELNGRVYDIKTGRIGRVSGGHKKRNLVLIGGGAGAGAAIGAVGGPGGVAIGAGVGATAGTVGAVFTGKKNVSLRVETPLEFRLKSAVEVAN